MRTTSAVFLLIVAAAAVADDEITVRRYTDSDSDRMPLFTTAPVYPREAQRDRIEGEVQVCYHIDRKGRPYRIAVRNSTHRIFEKPARLAIRASSWAPLEPGEKTSGIKSCRTFRFELEPVDEPAGGGASDER